MKKMNDGEFKKKMVGLFKQLVEEDKKQMKLIEKRKKFNEDMLKKFNKLG